MEEDDKESQICRLCGQRGSFFIDIFGEEGVKRFLGDKIHDKINILIDESDPLPKVICVQCLGKLEFVCDFQEECLRTQDLLRHRYNLPSISDNDQSTKINDVTIDDSYKQTSVPGTSLSDTSLNSTIINNNNNNLDKNLNATEDQNGLLEKLPDPEPEPRASRQSTKSLRSLRSSQCLTKNAREKKQALLSENEKENVREDQTAQTTEGLNTRLRRSKQDNVENIKTRSNKSIANRLRSQQNTEASAKVQQLQQQPQSPTQPSKILPTSQNIIQIPTSLLNKVLNALINSPNIDVSVKESPNSGSDVEDISFTVELCKKQEEGNDTPITVQAKVFPDQGTCLVDKEIVELLKDQDNVEIASIVSTIVTMSKDSARNNKPKTIEEKDIVTQNPEDLFKIDGEEIHVDDNVEPVVVNNQTSYACKLCRKVYERRDKCTVHVKTHLGIKQFTCIICQARFVCKSDVMKHIRCSHTNPRPVTCPKCPKRFRSKFDLAEHNNVHKGIKPYQCSDCDQSYHHKVSLQMHVKSHLPPQNLACEYCGKVFPFRTRLLSHIGSVHMKNKRNFRCRFCYNLYSSLAVLNEHIKTRHMTTYTCEICSKTFKVASKYKAHVLQHSNPKPYACTICNNKYASKAFLNEHVLKHQGLRKHVCQTCGSSFAQASHLAAHRHVHGEKTHVCPECGKKFNRRDNMKVHRKRHFGEAAKKKTANSKQKNVEEIEENNEESNQSMEEK